MEKRNTVFQNYLCVEGLAAMLLLGKNKAVGLVQPSKVDAKRLAFSKGIQHIQKILYCLGFGKGNVSTTLTDEKNINLFFRAEWS